MHGEATPAGKILDPFFGQQIGENSEGDRSQLKLAGVDSGQSVPPGMMDVEVTLGIRHESQQDSAGQGKRSDVDPAASRLDPVDPKGFEKRQPAADFPDPFLAPTDSEAEGQETSPV